MPAYAGTVRPVKIRATLAAMIPPAGTSPASAYELAALTERRAPPVILADMIDPITGDFASLTRGRPLADAFAIEAVRVQRESGAAVRDVGNRFAELRHVESNAPETIESMAREAFADAERAGVLELVAVAVERNAGDPAQIDVTVEYRDLLAARGAATRRLIFTR